MQPILDDLLAEWQDAPELSPEELCRDHPNLLPALRDQIAFMERVVQLAGSSVAVPFLPNFPVK